MKVSLNGGVLEGTCGGGSVGTALIPLGRAWQPTYQNIDEDMRPSTERANA